MIRKGKKTYLIKDIWIAYAKELVKEHPGTQSRHAKSTSMYTIFRRINGRNVEIMNYTRFRKIVEHYLTRARAAVIQGEAVNMYGGVGKVCARRVERDWTKPAMRRIDWGKTKKQPLVWNEEKQRHEYKNKIFFAGDEWCRIGWNRSRSLTNESYYEFAPTYSVSGGAIPGFRQEFAKALLKDPLLKYQYLYFPLALSNEIKQRQNGVRNKLNKRSDREDHNGNGSAGHTTDSRLCRVDTSGNGTDKDEECIGEEMGGRGDRIPQVATSL